MMAQDIVVYLIVLAAVVYLGRTLILAAAGRKACGGCGSGHKCGSTKVGAVPPAGPGQLIQIGLGSGFQGGAKGAMANGGDGHGNTVRSTPAPAGKAKPENSANE